MLVVLALLAIMSTFGLRAFRPPSPLMRLNAVLADFTLSAGLARSHAIIENVEQTLTFEHEKIQISNCLNSRLSPIVFFTDGTAQPTEICLALEGENVQFRIDGLTGRVVRP